MSAQVKTTTEPATAAALPEDQVASEVTDDFYWTYQEEPHRSRRKEIIKAHPQVTKLCGPEPLTKWVVAGVVLLQFTMAYLVRNEDFLSWKVWITAYFIGATCCHNVFLAIHEMSHNLAFKKPIHNKLFSIFANLPIGIPYSAGFGPYHLLHHKYLGHAELDTDLPTKLEAVVLSNVAGKAFFATFQILFYAIRPMFIMQLPFTNIHFLNILVQLVADYLLVSTFGWRPLHYLWLSGLLAGSWHPIAGHFIAEHYVLETKQQDVPQHLKGVSAVAPPETFSYYGWLNIFVYNAGYHSEHHDFPYIPWTRLPVLNKMAHEFYDPLPCHESWFYVIFDFVFDKRISLWNRVKRVKEEVDSDDYENLK